MILFAHRGASAYAPENTLPSFRKALEMGARAVELDVQLTSDGVPVVIHDFMLNKTTDGSGMVRDYTWKEIRRLDAGVRFGQEFRNVTIPSLEEVLALIPRDVCLNIEIKAVSLFREPVAAKVLTMTEQEPDRNLVFSSFNHVCLKELKDRNPDLRIGLLSGSHMIDYPAYVETTGLKPYSLNPEASYLTPELIREAHGRGWKVFTYTVNTPAQARLIADLGTDGIFSDYPDLLNGPVQ